MFRAAEELSSLEACYADLEQPTSIVLAQAIEGGSWLVQRLVLAPLDNLTGTVVVTPEGAPVLVVRVPGGRTLDLGDLRITPGVGRGVALIVSNACQVRWWRMLLSS